MSGEFRLELRKAFADIALLLAGAIAGGALGYLLLDGHWAAWAFPVIGAWLVFHGVHHFRRAGSRDR